MRALPVAAALLASLALPSPAAGQEEAPPEALPGLPAPAPEDEDGAPADEEQTDQKPQGEQADEEQPEEEQPAEEQPAEEQADEEPAEEQADEKPPEEQPPAADPAVVPPPPPADPEPAPSPAPPPAPDDDAPRREPAPAAPPDEEPEEQAAEGGLTPNPSLAPDDEFSLDEPPPPEDGEQEEQLPTAAEPGPTGWLQGLLGASSQPRFTLGVAGGYTLRMHDDERTHGAGLAAFVDVPLAYGFGVQVQGYGNGWIPSATAPNYLGLVGGAGSLLYAFDDTDAVAWVGVGPTVASAVTSGDEGTGFIPHAGALFQFGVRFPLGDATRAEVGIRAPVFLWDAQNGATLSAPLGFGSTAGLPEQQNQGLFPTQVMLTAGLNFEPFTFVDAMADHGSLMKALLPRWLTNFGARTRSVVRPGAEKDAPPEEAPPDEG